MLENPNILSAMADASEVTVVADAPDPSAGEFVSFPDSPFQLFQPYPPAGDQPAAITQLVEGLNDGLSFQTLLGVTGSGKTFTMANVIARMGRPAIVFAPNKTLAAQLYSEFREFFPKNAVEYFVSYYDYYQPEAYVPAARPVHREGQRDQRAHRADAAVGDEEPAGAARRGHRRQRLGDLRHRQPERLSPDGDDAARARQAGPARRDRAADPHAVHAQRGRLLARHVSRARRHDRRVSRPSTRSWRSASSSSTTRSIRCNSSIRSPDASARRSRASPSTRAATT
jgi:hypothetical protein